MLHPITVCACSYGVNLFLAHSPVLAARMGQPAHPRCFPSHPSPPVGTRQRPSSVPNCHNVPRPSSTFHRPSPSILPSAYIPRNPQKKPITPCFLTSFAQSSSPLSSTQDLCAILVDNRGAVRRPGAHYQPSVSAHHLPGFLLPRHRQ